MTAFTSWAIEIKPAAGGAWTDVTADVLSDPPVRWTRGITSTGLMDKIGGAGILTFSLNNSEGNSQGTRGYYALGVGSYFFPGSFVRLSFTFDSITRYKWYGRIEPDGIKIIPGILGARRVDVSCVDYMGLTARTYAELLSVQYNKRIEEAVHFLAHEVAIDAPLRYEYGTGDSTFSYIFDLQNNGAMIGTEFAKLAQSELGYVYVRGDDTGGETLVVEERTRRTDLVATITDADIDNYLSIPKVAAECDSLLKEDGDGLLLESGDAMLLEGLQSPLYNDDDIMDGMEYISTHNQHNYIKLSVTPRRLDASATTVLWTMESPLLVEAGTTVSGLRGRYRDPNGAASYVNGVDMVWPVANTDFQAFANSDGTGTDLTADMSVSVSFGTAEAEFSVTNSGGTDFYTGGEDITFQFRGRGVYKYDTVEVVKTSGSISTYGQQLSLAIDMEYQTDPNVGVDYIENKLFKGNSSSIQNVPLSANKNNFNMMSFMFLEPGALIGITETMTGATKHLYFVNGYEAEMTGGEIVNYNLFVINRLVLPTS